MLTSPKPCGKKPNAELSLTRDPYYCCLNVLLTVLLLPRFCCSHRGPCAPPNHHTPQQTLTPGTYGSLACPQSHTTDTMHTQIGPPKATPCPPFHQHHIHSDVHSTTRAATQTHSLSPERSDGRHYCSFTCLQCARHVQFHYSLDVWIIVIVKKLNQASIGQCCQ
jgi:hypothetical protein